MTPKSMALFAFASVGAYAAAKYGSPAATELLVARGKSRAAATLPATRPARSPPVIFAPDDEPWTGVLLADAVDLTAKIDTKVKSFAFRVGDPVRADDVVCVLDTTTQEHDIAAAEAALRASKAEAWSASVSMTQARERRSRRAKMIQIGDEQIPLVSEEELADSKFDALSASSRASAASATADERQARLDYLRQVVHDASLRAPFAGIVAARYVEPNAYVRQGSPVVRVVGRGGLRARFAVPESEAKGVRLSSRVVLEWDDRSLEATVDRIAPEVESASSSVVMEAVIDGAANGASDRGALAGRVVGVRLARPRPRG